MISNQLLIMSMETSFPITDHFPDHGQQKSGRTPDQKTLVESSAQYPADGTARCGLQLSVRRAYSAHRGQLPCRSAASRYDLPVYPESGGLLQQSSDRNLFPHDTLPVHSGQSPTPSGIFTSLRLLSRDYCLAAAYPRQ